MNIHCWGSGVWCCLWPRDLVNIVYQPDCDGYVCESDDVRGLESGARENRICLLLGVSKCGHPQLHVCGNFPEHLRLPGCKAACEGSRKGSVDLRVGRKQRICVSRGQWADPAGSLTLGQQLRLGCLQGECRGLLDLENGHKTGIDAKQWAWVECAGGGGAEEQQVQERLCSHKEAPLSRHHQDQAGLSTQVLLPDAYGCG